MPETSVSDQPEVSFKFPEPGEPVISYADIRESSEHSVYEKARAVVKALDKEFGELSKFGCIGSYHIALVGGSISEPRKPTDLDVLMIVDSVENNNFLAHKEELSVPAAKLYGQIEYAVKEGDHMGEVFEVRGLSDLDNFPKAVDFHIVSGEKFNQEINESLEDSRLKAIEFFYVMGLNNRFGAELTPKISQLGVLLAEIGEKGADTEHRRELLVDARNALDEILPKLDYYFAKNFKMSYYSYVNGTNFLKNVVNSGAILVKGDNPTVVGNKVFQREDQEFLK